MIIQSLQNTPLATIVECMLDAFSDYFVKMPTEVSYWENRYRTAMVDYESSVGVFDQDRLVAFIMHGIDIREGELTAFNTGTGVRSPYRGQALVDQMYDFAVPRLKDKAVKRCRLEVIQENFRAIRVYERIGFHRERLLKCYNGTLDTPPKKVSLESVPFAEMQKAYTSRSHLYSWDHTDQAILASAKKYQTYRVLDEDQQSVGHFVVDGSNGYIPQLEARYKKSWDAILSGIKQITPTTKINNVDDSRTSLLAALERNGLQNVIDQYEMDMSL